MKFLVPFFLPTILFGVFLLHVPLTAQPCSSSLNLGSQAEVDAINCDSIAGTLTISGSDIQDLSNLSQIQYAHGLWIIDNASLTSLVGLENLQLVPPADPNSQKPDVIIENNSRLASIQSLSLGPLDLGSFRVYRNDSLRTLQGPPQIESIQWFRVESNPLLEEITGFDSLKRAVFDESGIEGGEMSIRNNASLRHIDGFHELLVSGYLAINENSSLLTIDGFQKLEKVYGMSISQNDSLRSIDVFDALEHLYVPVDSYFQYPDFNLEILENKSLQSITGFNQLQNIYGEGVRIGENPALFSISGFTQLESLIYLSVFNNPNLSDLSGFTSGLEEVEALRLANLGIKELGGFSKLTTVSWMEILDNDSLERLSDLDLKKDSSSYSRPLSMEILGNSALRSIDSSFLPNAKEMTDLSITGNEVLSSIDGFLSVDSIVSYGSVRNGSLKISHNSRLERITGLSSLRYVADSLYLTQNPQATRCCGLYTLLQEGTVETLTSIHQGQNGCRLGNILSAGPCSALGDTTVMDTTMIDTTVIDTVVIDTSIQPPVLPDELVLGTPFPNPSYDLVNFPLELPEPIALNLIVLDSQGRRVLRIVLEQLEAGYHTLEVDINRLSPGLYFYHLRVGEEEQSASFFVQH